MKIEEEVGKRLKERKLTISVAESCTGGLIQKLITDISGSSEFFLGGVVAYSNLLKQKLLNVSPQTLITYGAVSDETACEMARGIRELTGADIGVSTTGIAGPTGETPDKPVGLVYIGLCTQYHSKLVSESLTAHRFLFKGTRQEIREQTANKALELVEKLKV